MGLNNEHAYAIVVDIETAAIDTARDYIEPIEAPANYKNPEAIEGYVQRATDRAIEKCSLDPDLCRIVALGWLRVGTDLEPRVLLCEGEHEEKYALTQFWLDVTREVSGGVHPLVTFNGFRFDLPVLMRRSQYLGVSHPLISLDRYRSPHIDLWQKLSFNGAIDGHSLSFYARRFGIPFDPMSGESVGRLVRDGEWQRVRAHCAMDVVTTYELAARLGYIEASDNEDEPEMVA